MNFLLSIFVTASVLTMEISLAGKVERKLGELTMQERAFLDAHNEFRSITALGNTGSQPMATNMCKLTWNDEIAYGAEECAARCKFAHDHENTDYGENLYAIA